MAKRTGAATFKSRDTALLIERQFLSTSHDSKEIYYEYENPHTELDLQDPNARGETSLKSVPRHDAASSGNPIEPEVPKLTASAPTLPQQVEAASIADVPISVIQIVQALVAQKLRKTIEQISSSKSIKELTGGKASRSREYLILPNHRKY
jgi:fatty acid synthase subunit alpha